MAVIGILTCEILEHEFAKLLSEDTEIGCINVLENGQSKRLITLLEDSGASNLRCLPHTHAFRADPDETLEVLVRVLELGLHRSKYLLRRALIKAAQELAPHMNVLMLGYGLCGNALDDCQTLLDVDVPIFQPMNRNRPVDDCVALCLGSQERYYTEQCENPATYFLTPGWSQHWRQMLTPGSDVLQPGMKRLLDGYQRALLVKTPALAEGEQRQCAAEFCHQTGLRLEECQGGMAPLIAAWNAAKQAVHDLFFQRERNVAL
jgi:hypothetical protein